MNNQTIKHPELRFPEFVGRGDYDWQVKRLGDIANIVGGGTPASNKAEYWNGDIIWYTPSELQDKFISKSQRTISRLGLKKSSAKLLPIGTMLLSTRATIGDIAITTQECTTNQGFQNLIVKDNQHNEFWYYWVLNNTKEFIRRASGSTFLEINKKEIQKISCLTPHPDEQKQIADFLSVIDRRIGILQGQYDLLCAYKQGVMQQIFTQKIRFKNPNGTPYPDWNIKSLLDISNIHRGVTYSKNDERKSGKCILRSNNIDLSGVLNLTDIKFIDKEIKDHQRIVKNDIMICMSNGSKEHIGKVCLFTSDTSYYFGGFMGVIRCNKGIIISDFLYYYMNSNKFKKFIFNSMVGTNINNLNNEILSSIDITIPTIDEQKQIADFLSAIDSKITTLNTQLTQTKKYKKSLMQKMFV